jgi:bisphosphoglycerate-dependent phosphoglycerate mutase
MGLNQEQCQTTQTLRTNNEHCPELPKQVSDRKQYGNKTVYQLFSMCHKNDSFDLKINNQKLPKSKSTKYLGIYMDNKLSWKNHMEQRLRLIKRLTRAKWGNTQETMSTMYKTYIKPLMKYGSEVLVTAGNSTLKALETTHNNALRLITRGVKTTPILALQLYTGHLPITCEIKNKPLFL